MHFAGMGLRVKPSFLRVLRAALEAEGFEEPILQLWKPGQVLGMVKDLASGMQVHVRAFEDGRVECEVEPQRRYLEHLNPRYRRRDDRIVAGIMARYGIPFEGEPVVTEADRPDTLTDWRALVACAVAAVALVALWRLGPRPHL